MSRIRSPFAKKARVRFQPCGDPACRCQEAKAWHGDVGTVTYTRGLSILVEFIANAMSTEIAFRKDTATSHLTRVADSTQGVKSHG